jgi:hypothetical protein
MQAIYNFEIEFICVKLASVKYTLNNFEFTTTKIFF